MTNNNRQVWVMRIRCGKDLITFKHHFSSKEEVEATAKRLFANDEVVIQRTR